MKEITKDTPKVDFLVQDVLLKVPSPFSKGDVLETEGEASSINQTYRENVRNNCAKAVKGIVEAEKDPVKAAAACQVEIDNYCAKYQFGVRTGGGRQADPAMTVAMGIAKKLVKDTWKAQGKKSTDYTAAEVTAAAEKVIEANEQIMDYARKEVAAKKNAVKGLQVNV